MEAGIIGSLYDDLPCDGISSSEFEFSRIGDLDEVLLDARSVKHTVAATRTLADNWGSHRQAGGVLGRAWRALDDLMVDRLEDNIVDSSAAGREETSQQGQN